MAIPKPHADITEAMQPIVLTDVPMKERILRFREPLMLQPVIENGWFVTRYPALDIVAGGSTRDELLQDLSDEICIAWELFADVDDERLTPQAQTLKQTLRSLLQEVEYATTQTEG